MSLKSDRLELGFGICPMELHPFHKMIVFCRNSCKPWREYSLSKYCPNNPALLVYMLCFETIWLLHCKLLL